MYSNYQSYGSSPYMSPMYPMNGSPFMQGGVGPNQGIVSGVTNSFDSINRFTQILSSTSESLHLAFTSTIRLFETFRALSSEFDSLGTSFSILSIVKNLLSALKKIAAKVLGINTSDLPKIPLPTIFAKFGENLGKMTDKFLFLTFLYSVFSAVKRLVGLLYQKFAPFDSILCTLPNGQNVEVCLPFDKQTAFSVAPSGSKCTVQIEQKEAEKDNLVDSKAKKEIKIGILAPNGIKIPLNFNETDVGKLEKYLEGRNTEQILKRVINEKKVKDSNFSEGNFYESNENKNSESLEGESFAKMNEAINSFNRGFNNTFSTSSQFGF